MFTGIIEDRGILRSIRRGSGYREVDIESELICGDLKVDESVAVNGICLTVTEVKGKQFRVQAVAETESRTTLEKWKTGDSVNLERAMPASGRLGGHVVQGHIDCVGELIGIKEWGENREYSILIPLEFVAYTVEKGSIAIDGVSLTIAYKKGRTLLFSLIPHSIKNTGFSNYKIGTKVNIETDIFGKYVVETIKSENKGIDKGILKGWGYNV